MNKREERYKCRTHNRQFGASGGVASWDTSQNFGSSPPVRALPIPPPDAKLLKRCAPAGDSLAKTSFFFLAPRGFQFRKKIEGL